VFRGGESTADSIVNVPDCEAGDEDYYLITLPLLNTSTCISGRIWSNLPAPQVASFLTSLRTAGLETRALIIERVLMPTKQIMIPSCLDERYIIEFEGMMLRNTEE
jgi:hypothetical protein